MMLLPIITSWMSLEGHRRLVQVLPDSVREWWDKWELRALILISLVSQIILTLLGNRRKYGTDLLTRSLVWSAYLTADWVATFALGVITSKLGDFYENCGAHKQDPQLIAFWAPFLLLHLGGPDTFTAYALEDNELWSRHLVQSVVQTLGVVYIILMSWKYSDWLSYLCIPMLVIGFVKYGERTWSLYSATIEHCRDSLLASFDPHPRYAKFMEECSSSRVKSLVEKKTVDTKNLLQGFMILFVSLFVDVIFSTQHLFEDRKYYQQIGFEEAFKVVENELGFAYDFFYTKASVIYTTWGSISRFVTSIVTIIVLVFFVIFVENKQHLLVDQIITYLLLSGAIISEFYSILLLVTSEWTNDWPRKKSKIISKILSWLQPSYRKRWSNSIAQYNILTLCLANKNVSGNFISVNKLEELLNITYCPISSEVQNVTYSYFLKKSDMIMTGNFANKDEVGNVIDLYGIEAIKWTKRLEFHQSILTWHIATDLCYHTDDSEGFSHAIQSKVSKMLSDYMLYLLVKQRHMLPVGTGLVRFGDTVAEAINFFQERKSFTADIRKASEQILLVNTEFSPIKVKGHRSKSVLFDGCRLAKSLWAMERERMWDFLTELWVEILGYAANHCRVDHHAQQLRRGGEFLSHVWLLQAHLGATEQFQMTREDLVKAKLDVAHLA